MRVLGGWLKEVALGTLPYAGRFEEAALRSSDDAESSGEAKLFEHGGFRRAVRFIFKHFEAGGGVALRTLRQGGFKEAKEAALGTLP